MNWSPYKRLSQPHPVYTVGEWSGIKTGYKPYDIASELKIPKSKDFHCTNLEWFLELIQQCKSKVQTRAIGVSYKNGVLHWFSFEGVLQIDLFYFFIFFLQKIFAEKMKFLIFLSFTLFVQSVSAQLPEYVPADSLIGWWPFNTNALDESGNGRNGTVNGANLTTDRFGIQNRAYAFNGLANNIQTQWPGVQGNGARTISFWFFSDVPIVPNGTTHGTQLGLVGWGSGGAGNQGRGFVTVLMDNNQIGQDINTAYKTANVNTLGEWTHVAITFSPTDGNTLNAVKMYINGLQITDINRTFNINTQINTGQQVNLIFGATNTAGQFFQGKLDDIGVWSRDLNAAEIKNLYDACDLKIVQSPANVSWEPGTTGQAKFFVRKTGEGVNFRWQTLVGNDFLDLINSSSVQGQGTDTLRLINPTASNNNQRFRCIIERQACSDTSEEATFSFLVVSNQKKMGGDFVIFPNPASEQFSISNAGDISSVSLVDCFGRYTLLKTIDKDTYSLAEISKGKYFIRIQKRSGEAFYKPLYVKPGKQ